MDNNQIEQLFYLYQKIIINFERYCFWKHKIYGDKFPKSTNEEFDKVLLEDSNNLDLWNLHSVIGHKQNRLVSYPCDYFHSKYPNEFKISRKVFVIFYKIKK